MTPDQIGQILRRLDVQDEKLDHLVEEQAAIKTQVTATNGRVSKLETWQAWLTGLAGGAFAVGLLADLGHRLGLFG